MFCRLCAPSTWGRATPPQTLQDSPRSCDACGTAASSTKPTTKMAQIFPSSQTLPDATRSYRTLPDPTRRAVPTVYGKIPHPTRPYQQILPALLPTEPYWVHISSDPRRCADPAQAFAPTGQCRCASQTRPLGSEARRVAMHGSAADTGRPRQSLPGPTRRYEQVGQVVKSGVSLNTANWWTRIDPKSTQNRSRIEPESI